MVSIGTQIKQIQGLVDTEDVTDWENLFILDVVDLTQAGKNTGALSERQVRCIGRIWEKHFA